MKSFTEVKPKFESKNEKEGALLKTRRKDELGFTRSGWAKFIGIKKSLVKMIENGEGGEDLDYLRGYYKFHVSQIIKKINETGITSN